MKWYQNQPILFLVISAGLVLLVALSVIYLSLKGPSPSPPPSSSPSPSIRPLQSGLPSSIPASSGITPQPSFTPGGGIYSEEYLKDVERINKQGEPQRKRDELVSKFIDTLPYKSQLIRVEYSISTNKITLFYPTGQKDQALKEFDELIKSNGIESRDWVYNLDVKPLLY